MDKQAGKRFGFRFGLTGAMVPLFWSYIVILLLAVITGGLLYWKAKDVVERTVDHTNTAMLGQLRELADSRLNEIELLEQQIAMHPKLYRILNSSDLTTGQGAFEAVEFTGDLHRYKNLSRFVYDYYIYIPKSGIMIGPNVKTSPEILFDNVYRFDGQDSGDWVAEFEQKRHYRTMKPAVKVRNDMNQTRSIISYMFSIAGSESSSVSATLLIMVDEEELRHMFLPLAEAGGGSIYLVDPEDRIISTTSQAKDDIRFSYGAMPGNSGKLEYRENGRDMVLSYSTSSVNGWKYVLAVPRDIFLNQVNLVKKWAIILLCISSFGGAAASFYLAYRNYVPLRDLVRGVMSGSGREAKRGMNEYELLKGMIESARLTESELRERLSQHAPIIRNNFLQRFIRGYVEETELGGDSLQAMGVRFLSTCYAVILLDVEKSKEDSDDKDEQEWPFISFVISNIATELANVAHLGYVTEMERGRLALLINFREERLPQAEQDITSLMDKLVFLLERRFHLRLSVGRSGIVHETGMLGEAFREALRRLDKTGAAAGEAVSAAMEAGSNLQARYDYPLEVEQQLVNLVKSGEEDKTLKLLAALYQENADSRAVAPAYGYCLLHAMAGTLLRIVQNTAQAEPVVLERLLLSGDWQGAGEQQLNERFLQLQEDYRIICRQWKAGRSNQGEMMIKEIRRFVNAHYGDNMLSVGKIADHLEITQPYLSAFFKKATGQNIADFIASVRIAQAKRLLAETTCTVAQIAEMVGYANDIGFIRFFRKSEGITPGAYRTNVASDRSSYI
ncbi:MAG: transcriptional regulator, AraC family [Paenibacillaceae bacterium]|jgi:AraC-like DNA-binding protein|nr:transcriptional regulator, AraC family [Paenibacillaceae bacterium]